MKDLCDIGFLNGIARKYGMEFSACHGDSAISGSPERSLARTLAEELSRDRYIVEEVSPGKVHNKGRLSGHLYCLKDMGVPCVHPPLKNLMGEVLTEHEGRVFQITPYVPGVDLSRPGYVMDGWRGEKLAEFLISLYGKSKYSAIISVERERGESFSIGGYVRRIFRDIQDRNPEVKDRVLPVISFLEDGFMGKEEGFPKIFCHGDFHVMNVIWSDSGVAGVIDWEFCGLRPDVYDVANLLGCIGIEDPNALAGPLVTRFLMKLTGSGLISREGWENLAEFIIALRFAWLAEWLRNGDREMTELELTYMKILLDNQAVLFR